MLETVPTKEELVALVGQNLYEVWAKACAGIEERYEMERLWNKGGKNWTYEYKYRRGGKTLCALYAREHCIGLMMIFGKEERKKFEEGREKYSSAILKAYDEAHTYHDGKWVMFELVDDSLLEELICLLQIKRRPNRK